MFFILFSHFGAQDLGLGLKAAAWGPGRAHSAGTPEGIPLQTVRTPSSKPVWGIKDTANRDMAMQSFTATWELGGCLHGTAKRLIGIRLVFVFSELIDNQLISVFVF